jgi:hypothetical protein
VTILDRLPIGDEPSVLFVGTEPVRVKRYQILDQPWITLPQIEHAGIGIQQI